MAILTSLRTALLHGARRQERTLHQKYRTKQKASEPPGLPSQPLLANCEQLAFYWAHLSIITQGVGLTLKRQLSGGFTDRTPGTDSCCHPYFSGHCQQWFQLEAAPGLLTGRRGGSNTRKQLLPAPAMTGILPASTFPHPGKHMLFLAAGQSGITSYGSRHWLGILREVRLTLNFHFLIH